MFVCVRVLYALVCGVDCIVKGYDHQGGDGTHENGGVGSDLARWWQHLCAQPRGLFLFLFLSLSLLLFLFC